MKNTVLTLQQAKKENKKITMLTAYDYSTARLMDEAGVNMLLVGDSLGNVVLGYEDTVSVTMEDMIHHGAAVARGAKNAMVVVDMPFMSYQTSVYDAVVNAGRLMKEARANAVKLEGGVNVAEQIKAIVAAGIPVVAHIGLTPQSVNVFGGHKVQGKTGGADHRADGHSHHRHRRGRGLRRSGAGISGHAGHVRGLHPQICQEIRERRRGNEGGVPSVYRRSQQRRVPVGGALLRDRRRNYGIAAVRRTGA